MGELTIAVRYVLLLLLGGLRSDDLAQGEKTLVNLDGFLLHLSSR